MSSGGFYASSSIKTSPTLSESTLTAIWNFLGRPEGIKIEQNTGTLSRPAYGLTTSPLPNAAAIYFGQLISTSSDRLFKEPHLLANEESRLGHEIEKLALDHYLVFINSSKSVSTLATQAEGFSNHLDELLNKINRLASVVEKVETDGQVLAKRREAFKKLFQNQEALSEILSVGRLMDVCIRNQFYDETYKLLNFTSEVIEFLSQSLPKSNDQKNNPLLTALNETLTFQRQRLLRVLLKRLEGTIDVPTFLATAGLLRQMEHQAKRSGGCLFPKSNIESEVLKRLASPLNELKKQAEVLFLSDPIRAMVHSCEALRTCAVDIGMNFITLFDSPSNSPQESPADHYLSNWISQQTFWLLNGLKKCLVPRYAEESLVATVQVLSKQRTSSQSKDNDLMAKPDGLDFSTRDTGSTAETISNGICQSSSETQTEYEPPSKEASKYFSQQLKAGKQGVGSDLSRLDELYRHVFSTSISFRRLRCEFFPLAAQYFDIFMENYLKCSLENARLEFLRQLDTYSWQPSSVILSSGAHPYMTSLTRHQPLAIFSNALIATSNELRLFPLLSFTLTAGRLMTEIFVEALFVLENVGRRLRVLDANGQRIGCWDRARFDEVPNGERKIVSRVRPQNANMTTSDNVYNGDHNSDAHWKSWTQQGSEYFLLCWSFIDDLIPLINDRLSEIYGDNQHSRHSLIDRDMVSKHVKGMLIPALPNILDKATDDSSA